MSTSLFEQYKAALRRGHVAALAADLEEALAAYDEAARLVPERALPLASRGTVLHRLNRWPEAAEAFDRALTLAPDDEATLRARATARAERGLRSGAAADYERLALALDVAGRSVDAADAARRAADLEPMPSREALADRLGAAAAHLADLTWGRGVAPASTQDGGADVEPVAVGESDSSTTTPAPSDAAPEPFAEAAAADAAPADDLESDATEDAPEAEAPDPGLEAAWAAMADRASGSPSPDDNAQPETGAEAQPAPLPDAGAHVDLGAFDALEALRAGFEAEERDAAAANAAAAAAAERAEAEGGSTSEALSEATADAVAMPEDLNGIEPVDAEGATWPGIDLPSPPPPPIEGPPPDPEDLLAEAALVLEAGEVVAARDLMLTAIRVHRDAGRTDAALDISLNLLAIAPGDPGVHLALANLQLDRGWTGVATEKLDLLVRLTSLTGDTQAEADVHGLAAERLRDTPATSSTGR